jgi:hypothetical protein
MTHKQMSPPAATGGARNYHKRTAFDGSEHSPSSVPLQQLRVAFLARRFGIAPGMAAAVADLAFDAREAR